MNTIKFLETYPDVIADWCHPGDICRFWSRPDSGLVYIYAPRSGGGQARLAEIDLDDNPWIRDRLDAGEQLWLELTTCSDTRFEFKVCSDEGSGEVPNSPPIRTPSGVRGVAWHAVTGKWKVTYQKRHFGLFRTIEEAAAALQAAKAIA